MSTVNSDQLLNYLKDTQIPMTKRDLAKAFGLKGDARIELKEAIPSSFKDKMDGWMFGCDVCQTVCPWNRFATPHQEAAFQPKGELLELTAKDWQELTEETFQRVFQKSASKNFLGFFLWF